MDLRGWIKLLHDLPSVPDTLRWLKPWDEMGRTYNTHDGRVINVKFWSGNLRERRSFEELAFRWEKTYGVFGLDH